MACRPRVGRILTPFGFRFRCSRVVGWGLEGLTARAMRTYPFGPSLVLLQLLTW